MRRSFFLFLMTLVLAAGTARSSSAQITPAGGTAAGDDTQPASARVGAVIFYDYTFQDTPKSTDTAGNTISPNAFNVTRAYLNITGNISHIVSYRITPDINSTRFTLAGNNMNGSYVFRLKYAYAQLALTDYTGQWTGSFVRLGIQQTPFIDYQESIYRYRFQGTVFAERDGGMSSSDAGVSFHANIPKTYGDFQVGLYNGEGYNGAEPNDQKALMMRGTVRPFPTSGNGLLKSVRLTGFYFGDHYLKDYQRKRLVGNVSIEQPKYNFSFDYMTRTDQNKTPPDTTKTESGGYSVVLTPFFQEKGNGWEALLRYDSFRPDSGNFSDRRQNRTIAGIAYWFPHPGGSGTAALMLDYEGVRYKNFPGQAKQNKVTLHGLINF